MTRDFRYRDIFGSDEDTKWMNFSNARGQWIFLHAWTLFQIIGSLSLSLSDAIRMPPHLYKESLEESVSNCDRTAAVGRSTLLKTFKEFQDGRLHMSKEAFPSAIPEGVYFSPYINRRDDPLHSFEQLLEAGVVKRVQEVYYSRLSGRPNATTRVNPGAGQSILFLNDYLLIQHLFCGFSVGFGDWVVEYMVPNLEDTSVQDIGVVQPNDRFMELQSAIQTKVIILMGTDVGL